MPLTIVMYHYVRDLERSRFPAIKGRTIEQFRGQLDHISAHYVPVTAHEIVAAAKGENQLPENACWLTFDDGYTDHYANVLPLLDERGWEGTFFIPAEPIVEGRLLDVNRIHFILASVSDPARIVEELRLAIESLRSADADIEPWETYVARYWGECHLDTPEVLFVKLMLQRGLPEHARNSIAERLFARLVTSDEAAFASELYMSPDQIRMLHRSGMAIGSHGYGHYWMDSLPRDAQAHDLDRSLGFLADLGIPQRDWLLCYPYGGYDADTLSLADERGCAIGVTTRPGVANLASDHRLELPRVDTIDLPIR